MLGGQAMESPETGAGGGLASLLLKRETRNAEMQNAETRNTEIQIAR